MVMETGYDIIFFWVARMIMLGLEMTGEIPFEVVYLHGLIRDEQGRKMSKSLGNAIDPLEVMDQFGTDALRFTLLTGSTPGNDMKLALSRVEANRNFANKIWNAARFIIGNLEGQPLQPGGWQDSDLALPDRWIISRQHRLTAEVTQLIKDWQFGEAGRRIYDFLWGEYCDWYIEIAKSRLYGADEATRETTKQVLVYVLERTLRLLHPFMPFVTEEIWQHLPHEGEALIVAPWPQAGVVEEQAETQMGTLVEIIRSVRNARAEYNVEAGRRIAAIIVASESSAILQSHRDMLVNLARISDESLVISAHLERKPARALALVIGGIEVYLPLAGMVDLEAEQKRLQAELAKTTAEIARVQALLSNEKFVARAPADVVERERGKIAYYHEQEAKLRARLQTLQ
jgi:valyl-tRNA synthetase